MQSCKKLRPKSVYFEQFGYAGRNWAISSVTIVTSPLQWNLVKVTNPRWIVATIKYDHSRLPAIKTILDQIHYITLKDFAQLYSFLVN